MKLSIVIVSWNVRGELIRCLRSIEQNPPGCPYEVIVADNGSKDGTVDCLRHDFPQVKLLANGKNLGFAAANNMAIREASGEYLLLLNPDTQVLQYSLDRLLEWTQAHPDIGICGPKLLNPDGSIQESVRRFPTFRAALYRYTFLNYFGLFRHAHRQWMAKQFDYSRPQEVEQVMGAALLIPRKVLDAVGLLDETFFMYYEEVDLCRRVINKGWKVVYFPDSQIIHLGGKSSDQIPAQVQFMRICSLLNYFRKHRDPLQVVFFSVILKTGLGCKHLVVLIQTFVLLLLSGIWRNLGRKEKNVKKLRHTFKFMLRYYPKVLLR